MKVRAPKYENEEVEKKRRGTSIDKIVRERDFWVENDTASDEYRYGFRGVEGSNEMKGNSHTTRFHPYHFVSNSPIITKDFEGVPNSVQLNYNETSVTITRDANNRFTVDRALIGQIPDNYVRMSNGSWGIRDLTPEGYGWEVYCSDCWGSYGKGAYVHITIPKAKVMRMEDVVIQGNKTQNDESGNRISWVTTRDGASVPIAENTESDLEQMKSVWAGGYIEKLTGQIRKGAKITSVNIQVNSALGEDFRQDLENRLTEKYRDKYNFNIELDEFLGDTIQIQADIDYEYTETVTKEVDPVVINPTG